MKAIRQFEEEIKMERVNSFQQYGMEVGREEGLQAGLQAGREEVARKMLAKGMPAEDILELTGLRIEEVRAVQDPPAKPAAKKQRRA